MNKKTEGQVEKLLTALKAAAEDRDMAAIAELLGPDTTIHAYGDFMTVQQLSEEMKTVVAKIEEVVVVVGSLGQYKERGRMLSVTFPLEVSFVDKTSWTLKRFGTSISLQVADTGEAVKIANLTLTELRAIGVHPPELIGGISGVSGPPTMGAFPAFVGQPHFMASHLGALGGVSVAGGFPTSAPWGPISTPLVVMMPMVFDPRAFGSLLGQFPQWHGEPLGGLSA